MRAENHLTHNWLAMKIANELVRRSLPKLSGIVIDLGCGLRPYEQDILRYADCYIGLDWNHTLHGLNAEIVADLNRPLPISDDIADYVVSFEVLEHLVEPGIMLSEAWRILRPSGGLALSVPFQWWLHEAPWDYQRFTRYGLEYQLRKAGFQDIDITETSGFWAMWVLKLNYQLARLIRGPRPARLLMRSVLIPFWWTGQILAPLIDRCWHEHRETAGYFVTARKP